VLGRSLDLVCYIAFSVADGNTSMGVISLKLGRSEDAVRAKAQAEGISLAQANRPPFGDNELSPAQLLPDCCDAVQSCRQLGVDSGSAEARNML
jgi:hypothetical protein